LGILGNFESRDLELNEKKSIVDAVTEKFKLNRQFHLELVEEIRNEDIKDDEDIYDYILTLPVSLKNRLIKKIYREILSTISFF
jgi:hypothetical protein